MTRGEFLLRGGALVGAAALGPLALTRVPSAAGAGTIADEAGYLFDPRATVFLPDASVWRREGGLEPVAVPGRGLGADGVESSLAYVHPTSQLPAGVAAGLTAQVSTPPVPDDSGAWFEDAISPRLTLDDGVVHAELAWARAPRTGARLLRLEGAPGAAPLEFPWDNGFANVVELRRRRDGLVELRATEMAPGGFVGLENQLYEIEVLPPSDGRPRTEFKWDRDDRSEGDSSCWVRVSSQWGGAALGQIFLPEIGDEVAVAFEEGDPDQPIVTGSVYNADRLPPFPLAFEPLRDVVTVVTTSGFGPAGFDRMVLDETSGREFVFRDRDGPVATTLRFREIDPPFVWGMRFEQRRPQTIFPLAVAQDEDELVASLLLELQIGDMTGSQLFRLRGPRRRRTVLTT